MDTITYADFAKVVIRMGEVKAAAVPEGSEKVIKLTVDFGNEIGERTIFAGIKKWYEAGQLIGKKLPFIVNIEPKKMGNLGYSQGMLMAVISGQDDDNEHAVILEPKGEVKAGDRVI